MDLFIVLELMVFQLIAYNSHFQKLFLFIYDFEFALFFLF